MLLRTRVTIVLVWLLIGGVLWGAYKLGLIGSAPLTLREWFALVVCVLALLFGLVASFFMFIQKKETTEEYRERD